MARRERLIPIVAAVCLAFINTPFASAQTLLGNGDAGDSFFAKQFVELNGTVYFNAGSFVSLGSIWRTDGTGAGTEAFATPPQDGLEIPTYLMSTGTGLAFVAESEDESTSDLWTSDGTTAGTANRFVNIEGAFEMDGRFASAIAAVGNSIIAYTRPWVFSMDVTSGDTTNLVETNTDVMFVQADDFAYLFAQTSRLETNGLLRTDGTKAGTVLLASGLTSDDEYVVVSGNRLIAIAEMIGDTRELFVSDGTVVGSRFLSELVPGGSRIDCSGVEIAGGTAYFGVDVPGEAGCIPYQSDGTDAGTRPVADTLGLELRFFGTTSQYVLWAEGLGNLWRSDGTVSGTVRVGDYGLILSRVIGFNGKAYFVTLNQTTSITELWQTDGTPSGTTSIFTPPLGTTGPIDARSMTVIGDRLYFSAYNTYYLEGIPTGTESSRFSESFDLAAYPNPFRDRLSIRIVQSSSQDGVGAFEYAARVMGQPVTISLVDILGREVFRPVTFRPNDPIELDLSEMATGVYFVTVRSATDTLVEKVVRVH